MEAVEVGDDEPRADAVVSEATEWYVYPSPEEIEIAQEQWKYHAGEHLTLSGEAIDIQRCQHKECARAVAVYRAMIRSERPPNYGNEN